VSNADKRQHAFSRDPLYMLHNDKHESKSQSERFEAFLDNDDDYIEISPPKTDTEKHPPIMPAARKRPVPMGVSATNKSAVKKRLSVDMMEVLPTNKEPSDDDACPNSENQSQIMGGSTRAEASERASGGREQMAFSAFLESNDVAFESQAGKKMSEAVSGQEITLAPKPPSSPPTDEERQAALSAQLDRDEEQELKSLPTTQLGSVSVEVDLESEHEQDTHDLRDDQIVSLRAMLIADNPVDKEVEPYDDEITAVVFDSDKKKRRVSNLEKSRPYLVAFSAGVAVAFVGRRLLSLFIGRGLL